ncbi:MAG: tRNA lysidine(34) synthetase TilS [Planctomycetes bacterium]|nr:tRNA lysidine(34) synthetase TilS [Planctomycetota bacterium]
MTVARDFLNSLRTGLRHCDLHSTRVLIGVSGGADSVALLRGLLELRDEFSLTLHVGHLNHQLRGAASDADADWVRNLCESNSVPVTIGIGGLNLPQSGQGVEEAARDARHQFLNESAAQSGCQAIVTAHTADDQVETVLHHLFRGTGLSGLRGIPAIRSTASGIRLVRPMLSIRRELVETYLVKIAQTFCTDATNADTTLTRNWLRHKLLPDLNSQFGPHVSQSVLRLAEQAAEIEQTLTCLAERLLDQVLLDAQPDAVRLDTRPLADQPVHLVRELFRAIWQRQQWPRQAMGSTEWNRLAQVALDGGDANLPGQIRARQNPPGLMLVEKTNRQTAVRS